MKREAAIATCALVNNKNNNRPDVGWDELGKCFEADYNFIAPHQSSGGCNKYQQLKHSFSRLLREKLFYWKFRSDQHHLINLQINGWLEVGVLFNSNHFLFLKKSLQFHQLCTGLNYIFQIVIKEITGLDIMSTLYYLQKANILISQRRL